MNKICIIGVGPGAIEYVVPVALRRIKDADCLIGAQRALDLFSRFKKEKVCFDGWLSRVVPYLKKHREDKKIAVLVSGDPGLYSLAHTIAKEFKKDEYEVIPGISSLQIAFARIGESWQDVKIISLHGRKISPENLGAKESIKRTENRQKVIAEGDFLAGEMLGCLKRYWGYTEFRPWQEETILSVMDNRDSLTVLPTGGGISLCFQLPAMLKGGTAVVISPLISLMKDQVDNLKDMGIPADYLNSSQSPDAQKSVIERIRQGKVKLLYISPERLQGEWTLSLLKSIEVSFFVIDEAHCISHWGHDFREDYRNLGIIKEEFPGIATHAFTATATKEVQGDILGQLRLD